MKLVRSQAVKMRGSWLTTRARIRLSGPPLEVEAVSLHVSIRAKSHPERASSRNFAKLLKLPN